MVTKRSGGKNTGGKDRRRYGYGGAAYSHRRMSLNGTLEGVGSGGSFPRVF
jgi:hypothetical protein